MSGDWRKLRATPQRLWRFFDSGDLPPDAWKACQEIAGQVPTAGQWMSFAERLLIASGTIFLIAGVFFFFAFNWDDLPRLARFALIQGAVVIATIMAFFLKIETWSGRIALGAAAMLVGATFAVVGQAYQTGADSYRLFMMWAIVITGWVLISRWNIMWFIWLVLINLTLGLYWNQIIGDNYQILNLLTMTLNIGFIIAWDTAAKFDLFDFMRKGRWFLYFLLIPALAQATSMMWDYIFNDSQYHVIAFGNWTPLIYIGALVIIGGFYTLMRRDLAMLTMASVSVLIVSISASGKLIFEAAFTNTNDPFAFFLIMGIITISLTGGLALGLRRLQNVWGDES